MQTKCNGCEKTAEKPKKIKRLPSLEELLKFCDGIEKVAGAMDEGLKPLKK